MNTIRLICRYIGLIQLPNNSTSKFSSGLVMMESIYPFDIELTLMMLMVANLANTK